MRVAVFPSMSTDLSHRAPRGKRKFLHLRRNSIPHPRPTPRPSTQESIILNHSFLLHVKKVKVAQSCPTLQPHGLYSPWNSLDQNSGVGRFSLLQGIFPTQGSNPDLPQWIPTILLPRCLLNPAPCFPTVTTVMLTGLFIISCLDHGPGFSLSSTSMLLLLLLLNHFSRVCLCATP